MKSHQPSHLVAKTRLLYYVSGISAAGLIPYLALWFHANGLSSPQIGLIFAVSMAIGIIAQPLWGIFVDHFPTSRLPLLLVMGVPGFMALGFNAKQWPVLLTMAIGFNIFMVSRASLSDAYAVSVVQTTGTHYSTIRLFGSMGAATGAYLSGLYIAHLSIHSLWAPFLISSILSAALIFVLPRGATSRAPVSFWSTLRHAVANPTFVLFLLGAFLVQQTLTAYDTFFTTAFHHIGGAFSDTGFALAVGSMSNVPSMLLAARLIKRWTPSRVMVFAAIVYTVRWTLMALFPIPWVYIVLQALHGISFGLFWVSGVQYVATLFPDHLRASGQSIFSMISVGLAAIVGNLINGIALNLGGPNIMYSLAAVSSTAGLVVLVVLMRSATSVAHQHVAKTPPMSQ